MNWQQLSQSTLEDIVAWAEDQPWCHAMADCQQDSGWHAEGDVWTHTKMVCAELPKLEEWPALNTHEQTVLIFTALFHDAAKPLTTQVDSISGRVRSPKHAVKGEHLARSVLRGLECDLITREEIARLVRFHGRPIFLFEREDPNHEVVSMSWLVNNRLLYLFALADTRGRKAAEMARPEETLHLWKLTAEENNCFTQPYPFVNDHARFLFYRQAEKNLHYVPHEDYTCTVTLLSGLPGSGKDTWFAKHQTTEQPVVSLDEIRSEINVSPTGNQGEVIQLAKERCREYLRSKTSFTFNATNTVKQTRTLWINLFADYGARIELIYVEPSFSVILKQNKKRERFVPEHVICKLADKCEPPTWTEGHKLVVTDGECAMKYH
ncbi:MAG: phosphohydrolase [Blastopirellula sp.]|nr:MAG: phosphohydrolase [Blastopirellula sp.]